MNQPLQDFRGQALVMARMLGVSIEHVRYAVERLHRPTPDYRPCTAPGSRRLQSRAAAVLTADFLHLELVQHGKDITAVAADTGFSRHTVHVRARQAGINPTTRRLRPPAEKIEHAAKSGNRRRGYAIEP